MQIVIENIIENYQNLKRILRMVDYCPNCNSLVVHDRFNTEINHDCNSGDTVLDNESVLVIGDWEDFTGSAVVQPSIIGVAGVGNELRGTIAGFRGAKDFTRDVRGFNVELYRSRRRIKNVQFPDFRGNESKT